MRQRDIMTSAPEPPPETATPRAPEPLLEVRDLRTHFVTPDGVVRAVDGVSFSLNTGEALGIVGESGSGKSVTALSLLRLFGPFTEMRSSGEALFAGRDLLRMSERELREVRGGEIGMVFQDPLTSLNPVMPVGDQVAESVRRHTGAGRAQARRRAVELLDLVGIGDPGSRYGDLPHHFSGGMRQRVMIAIAVAARPRLLIADEPTTALDVTVQAQVLLLLDELRRELGMALILISHDFGVIASACDRVQVMYAGRIVERSSLKHLLLRGNHPYTEGLLELVPRFDDDLSGQRQLEPIPGQPPRLLETVAGCAFAPRCRHAHDRCDRDRPPLHRLGPDHASACWLAEERARR